MKQFLTNIFSILTKKERARVIWLIFFDLLISLLDIAFLVALIFVVRFYTSPDHTLPFSFFAVKYFVSNPLSLIIIFFILFTAKNTLGYLVFKMQYGFLFSVAARLSQNELRYFLEGGYDRYTMENSSTQVRRISEQPIQFGQHVLGGVQQIVGQALLILLTVIIILVYSPLLFVLLVVLLTPPLILIGILIRRRLKTIRNAARPLSETSLQYLQEALSGYIESNIFQSNDFFVKRYSRQQAGFNDFLSKQMGVQQLPSRFMEVFAVFGLLVLIVLSFYSNGRSSIDLVLVGAFMGAAYKIIPGITKIMNSAGQIKTYSFTINGLLLHTTAKSTHEEKKVSSIKNISIDHVSFAYGDHELLKDFSAEMKAGEMVGIKGRSGKGKTTLINLLLGFVEPRAGTVQFNNEPRVTGSRQQIAYVKQTAFLINDTIRRNICLGDEAVDSERLRVAVNVAGLDTAMAQYPGGLEKLITENGKNISGGQRQRIMIARALYKDASLIILDEAFNELDRNSERAILQNLKAIADGGKIVVLITHNTESFSFCNKIINLDEA